MQVISAFMHVYVWMGIVQVFVCANVSTHTQSSKSKQNHLPFIVRKLKYKIKRTIFKLMNHDQVYAHTA